MRSILTTGKAIERIRPFHGKKCPNIIKIRSLKDLIYIKINQIFSVTPCLFKKILLIFLFSFLIPLSTAAITFGPPLGYPTFEELINSIINFIFWVAMAIAPIMIIIAAFYFLTSAGDPEKVRTAKRIILFTFIGLIIVLSGRGIVALVEQILWGGPPPPPAAEICNNAIDDDGDGLIDCADPDCAGDPICLPLPLPTCNEIGGDCILKGICDLEPDLECVASPDCLAPKCCCVSIAPPPPPPPCDHDGVCERAGGENCDNCPDCFCFAPHSECCPLNGDYYCFTICPM